MSNLPVFRLPITSKPSAPKIMPIFENSLSTFTIDSPAHHDSRVPVESPSPLVAASTPQVETKIIDTATSKRQGSITHDRENQRPTHEWNSLEEFFLWRINEELEHGIELRLSSSKCRSTTDSDGCPPLWHEKRTYSCSRQGTGGKTKYVRKCMDSRVTKRPSRRTGCRCRVRIKTYQTVSTVLGWYESEHDHATGAANLMYTRLWDSTRAHVLNLLRTNMSPKEVLTRVRRAHGRHEPGHYLTMEDIYHLERIVEEEKASQSMSNHEHSEGSPINEDEEPTTQAEDTSDTGSTTEVDDDLNVVDEQSDGYADPGIVTSPPPGSAISHLYTAAAGMKSAASPVVPAASVEPTVSPASSVAPAISPIAPAPSMESTAFPVVPATQPTHIAPPLPVPTPHDLPAGWYMPPPVVIYIPNPPYRMTLYPLYPVYFPSPTR